MRTTIDLSEDAYQIAKTVARERKESLGRVVSQMIIGEASSPAGSNELRKVGGFLTFTCGRRITSEDVKALEDEN